MSIPARLPSARTAAQRVRIKRRLRRAGIYPAWDVSTRDLIVLVCGLPRCRPGASDVEISCVKEGV